MGRKRKNQEDNKLPPRVYSNKYSYYYKPTSKECITIGPVSMPLSQLWARYEALIDEQANIMTFSKLWGLFLKSAYYLELKPRTQKDYLQHQKKLLAVFGKITADKIKTEDIRMFMDRRGLQSKTQANHEMSSMSRVFRWGFERGMVKRILARASVNLKLSPAGGTLPTRNTRPSIRRRMMSFVQQWK